MDDLRKKLIESGIACTFWWKIPEVSPQTQTEFENIMNEIINSQTDIKYIKETLLYNIKTLKDDLENKKY